VDIAHLGTRFGQFDRNSARIKIFDQSLHNRSHLFNEAPRGNFSKLLLSPFAIPRPVACARIENMSAFRSGSLLASPQDIPVENMQEFDREKQS